MISVFFESIKNMNKAFRGFLKLELKDAKIHMKNEHVRK